MSGMLDLEAARELLYREAYLLDRHRFDDWLALYTEDATYWLPLEHQQADAINTSSIVYDDRRLMELRVAQARHPRAHARVPAARTVHQVGNVLLLSQAADSAVVASTLILSEFRAERQRMFAALVEHTLRATPDGWKIAAKRVDLINSEGELDGIAVIF